MIILALSKVKKKFSQQYACSRYRPAHILLHELNASLAYPFDFELLVSHNSIANNGNGNGNTSSEKDDRHLRHKCE
jgi:hypothetical protein